MRKNWILVLMLFTVLSACKDKDEPSEVAVLLGKLSDTWALTSATKDEVEMEGYEDFTLTLSGSTAASAFTYAAAGRPELSPWLPGGSWSFGTTVSSQIVRDGGTDDELLITYTLTSNTLTLEFDFSGDGYENNRVNSSEGHWVFTFGKQ